jgi:hypothetical protein
MNANELADSIEHLIELTTVSKVRDCDFSAIATMLRQQQEKITKYELRHAEQRKRIAELEAENKFFKDFMGDVEILRKASEK